MDTVAELLRSAAERHPGRVAVAGADGTTTTYGGLFGAAARAANALLAQGLRPGDRVVAWMTDGPRYVELYAACALAGLVVVPVNARYTAHEARHLVVDSGARALVYSPAMLERVEALADVLAGVRLVVDGPAPPGQLSYRDIRDGGAADPPPLPDRDALYILGYTSGTTGKPKGARLTQGSVSAIARLNALSYRLPVGSVAALTGSMSFVAVVPAHIFSHFYVGGTVVFLGEWDVESLSHTIAQRRATFTYAPSPLLTEITRSWQQHPRRWNSLTTVLHSASKAASDVLRAFSEVSGGRLVEGWGMTENSGGLVTATSPADLSAETGLFDTVGRAVAETGVRVVDADGTNLPHDGVTVGELVVSSPALADGYWNQPDATSAAFRDGWYHTGDLGTVDPGGYVRIAERRTDLIVSGGMNVYPSEVEQVIGADPRVAACAVVGIPHPQWGQAVAAAVVRAPGTGLDATDIVEVCRAHLASYKKPTAVVFLDALPMTHSLKVSRAEVRRLVRAEHE